MDTAYVLWTVHPIIHALKMTGAKSPVSLYAKPYVIYVTQSVQRFIIKFTPSYPSS